MPFKQIGPNKYRSPSGKILTREQIKAYYSKKKKGKRKK